MNKLKKRINLAANLTIILVLVVIGIVFAKNYLLSAPSTHPSRDYRVPAGQRVSLPGIDWGNNGQTVLLVLEKGCPYCAESAPFYQQLAREAARKGGVQLIAVLPQEVPESKQYLSGLNVPIYDVRQSALELLGVQGTPTLILVNRNGEVTQSWAGKLPPEEEAEVLRRIGEKNDSM
jgi:thiol-disulfide isomerase/thioredoxin